MVGLVGEGKRFEALARLLEQNDNELRYWQLEKEGGLEEAEVDVEAVSLPELADAPLIFVDEPIHRMRRTANALGDVLDGHHVLVHLGRELEHATLDAISTMFEEETPTRRFGFLTGPMRLEDVRAGRPASSVCASVFPEVTELVEEALGQSNFRLYRNEDLRGSEAAAAYTRVIAMICGMADEMEMGASLQATLFARGLAETSEFVLWKGGYERTTYGLAGAGNLRADTAGAGSADFQLGGRIIARDGMTLTTLREDFGSEGRALASLLESLVSGTRRAELELHLLKTAERVLIDEVALDEALAELMALPTLHE